MTVKPIRTFYTIQTKTKKNWKTFFDWKKKQKKKTFFFLCSKIHLVHPFHWFLLYSWHMISRFCFAFIFIAMKLNNINTWYLNWKLFIILLIIQVIDIQFCIWNTPNEFYRKNINLIDSIALYLISYQNKNT